MDADSDIAEKINELLGVVAALKAYVAHLPGAAEVDLDAVRRAGRDAGCGLVGGVHPATRVSVAVDVMLRMDCAIKHPTDCPLTHHTRPRERGRCGSEGTAPSNSGEDLEHGAGPAVREKQGQGFR